MPIQIDLDRLAVFHNQRLLDRHIVRQGDAAAVGQCGTQFGIVVDVGLVELRINRHVERTLFGQQVTGYVGAVVAADGIFLKSPLVEISVVPLRNVIEKSASVASSTGAQI